MFQLPTSLEFEIKVWSCGTCIKMNWGVWHSTKFLGLDIWTNPLARLYPEDYLVVGDQMTQMAKDHARWNLTMHGLLLLDNHCELEFLFKGMQNQSCTSIPSSCIKWKSICFPLSLLNEFLYTKKKKKEKRVFDSQVPTIYIGGC